MKDSGEVGPPRASYKVVGEVFDELWTKTRAYESAEARGEFERCFEAFLGGAGWTREEYRAALDEEIDETRKHWGGGHGVTPADVVREAVEKAKGGGT